MMDCKTAVYRWNGICVFANVAARYFVYCVDVAAFDGAAFVDGDEADADAFVDDDDADESVNRIDVVV